MADTTVLPVLHAMLVKQWYCKQKDVCGLVQIVCILHAVYAVIFTVILLDQPGLAQGDEEDEVVVMAEVDLLNESAIETKKQLVVADTK